MTHASIRNNLPWYRQVFSPSLTLTHNQVHLQEPSHLFPPCKVGELEVPGCIGHVPFWIQAQPLLQGFVLGTRLSAGNRRDRDNFFSRLRAKLGWSYLYRYYHPRAERSESKKTTITTFRPEKQTFRHAWHQRCLIGSHSFSMWSIHNVCSLHSERMSCHTWSNSAGVCAFCKFVTDVLNFRIVFSTPWSGLSRICYRNKWIKHSFFSIHSLFLW